VKIFDDNTEFYFPAEHADGYGFIPRQSKIGEYAATFAESMPLIPESQWKQRIEEQRGKFPRQSYERVKPVLQNQNGLPYCWAYSLTQCVECLRASAGLPYVQLAPESLGGAVGWRRAGNSLDSALQYAVEHGIAARELVPQYDLNPRNYKQGWQDDAKKHCVLEWFDGGAKDRWAETVTSLLSGLPCYVAYNWARHALMASELQIVDGQIAVYLNNTWPAGEGDSWLLKGNRAIPDELYVLRSVTYA
jgi:hypothetical protein